MLIEEGRMVKNHALIWFIHGSYVDYCDIACKKTQKKMLEILFMGGDLLNLYTFYVCVADDGAVPSISKIKED